MSKLNKTASGLLFYDDFSEHTLLWQLSPSDANCIEYTENGLRITHNRRYVTFTMVEPELDEYSCVVKVDHIPFNYEDIAGVIVVSNTKDYAECQTFLATGPSELGNSETINTDIERLINNALDDKYVIWSENDDEPSSGAGSSVGSAGSTGDGSDNIQGGFQDTIYKYIKFTKQKYKYLFWASEDSKKWIEVGNVKFDNSGVIGFFLYGTTDQELIDNSHCYFQKFALYTDRYIIIDGISRNYEFEIFDDEGTILIRTDDTAFYSIFNRSNTRTIINTINMPMPITNATLRVFSKSNYEHTIMSFNMGEETYGGDIFTLERNIRVSIGQTEIRTDEIYDLGTFFRGNYFIKASVTNCEDYPLADVKVRVVKYSEYYSGEQEVFIALHDENMREEELDYKKELVIPELKISESRDIFIRLLDEPDQGFYMAANDYRFKIMIE